MPETPTDDLPGFVAGEPEHCHDCYRLIRPGQTYFLTIEQAILTLAAHPGWGRASRGSLHCHRR